MLGISRRPPVIETVEPDRALPGEIVVVRGRNFGSDGRLEMDGVAVDHSVLRGWNEERITFVMPQNLRSGMIRVQNDGGRSNTVFLMNRRDVPEPTAEALRSRAVVPREARPGTMVTVEGIGFGPRTALAYLGFHREDDRAAQRFSADSWWITSWSDRRIQFMVPGDLQEGPVRISVNGTVLRDDLTLLAPAGTVSYDEPRRYDVRQSLSVNGGEEGLRALIARLPTHPAQPEVDLLAETGDRTDEDTPSAWVYSPTEDSAGEDGTDVGDAPESDREHFRRAMRSDRVLRRAVRWEIESTAPAARLLEPDFRRALRRYLGDRDGVPATSRQILDIRTRSVDLRRTAPEIARRVHTVVQSLLEPDPMGTLDLASALDGAPAAAAVYAELATALMRSSGLPARRHFGVFLDDAGTAWEHAWLEVFLPDVGWVPADPALGDGMYNEIASQARAFYGDEPASATFGTLDDRRITVHIDGTLDPRLYPAGGVLSPDEDSIRRILRVEVPDPAAMPSLTVQWERLRLLN